MNIDHVNEDIKIPKSIMISIFYHQMNLMEKYDIIEKKNGIIVPLSPWYIDDSAVQYRIKDMFWRFTEEIAEAMECISFSTEHLKWKEVWDDDVNVRHFFEELADSFHFLMEASIIANLDMTDLQELMDKMICKEQNDNEAICTLTSHKIHELAADVIFQLGIVANTLKNKPWKSTQMPTDISKFKHIFVLSWIKYFSFWTFLGCSQSDIYELYHRKMRVNEFRQSSNY